MINEKAIRISSELHMIYISSKNVRRPVTKTFTTLHYTSGEFLSSNLKQIPSPSPQHHLFVPLLVSRYNPGVLLEGLSKAMECTRWFKYDRDCNRLAYTQIVPVIFEPPCS